jgi:hypothetical protein
MSKVDAVPALWTQGLMSGNFPPIDSPGDLCMVLQWFWVPLGALTVLVIYQQVRIY